MNNIPFTHSTTKKKPNNGQTHLTCCKWKRNYMIEISIVQFTEKLGNAQKKMVRFFVQVSNPCGPMGSLHATWVSIQPHETEIPWYEISLNSSRSLCLKPLSFMSFPSQAPACQNRVQFRSILMAPIWASTASITSQEPQVTVISTEANVDD